MLIASKIMKKTSTNCRTSENLKKCRATQNKFLTRKFLLVAFFVVYLSTISSAKADGKGAIIIGAIQDLDTLQTITRRTEQDFWYPVAKKLEISQFNNEKNRFLNFMGKKGIKVKMQHYKYGHQTVAQDHYQQKMIFELDEEYIKSLINKYNNGNNNLFTIKGDDGGKGHTVKSGETLTFAGDDNIKTVVNGSKINIQLKGDLVNIKSIGSGKNKEIEIIARDKSGQEKKYIFGGDSIKEESVLTKKDLEDKYARRDASNITDSNNQKKWRDTLSVYSKEEVNNKGITFKGTDGKSEKVLLDKKVTFASSKAKTETSGSQDADDITVTATQISDGVGLNLKLNKSDKVQDGDMRAVTSDAVSKKFKEISGDVTGQLGKATIKYKANGTNDKTVSLKEGLDFRNTENITAKVEEKGKVSFELNKDLKNVNSITAEGNNHFTITAKGKTYKFGDDNDKDSIVTKEKLKEDLKAKADLDAGNLDQEVLVNGQKRKAKDVWQEKLGDGKNEKDNKGLITGDTLYKATKDLAKKTDLDQFIKKGDKLFTVNVGGKTQEIKHNEELKFTAGRNLKVENKDGIKYSMVDNPDFDSITLNNKVKLEKSKTGGLKVSSEGKPTTIENVKSGIEWKNDETDKTLKPLKDSKLDSNVVTVKDLKKVADAGINFATDKGDIRRGLGETLNVQGARIDDHQNVLTSVNSQKGGVDIALNDDLKIKNSVSVGKKGSDSSTLTSDSLEFKDKDGKTKFKINSDGTMTGYNANSGNSIATIDHVNKAKAELSQGIASVAAMTNIPQVQSDHYFSIGAGVGYYKGKSAVAVGISGQNKAENIVYKASVGFDGSNATIGAGLNYNFNKKASKDAVIRDLEDKLNAKIQELDDKINDLNSVNNINIDNSSEGFREQLYVVRNFEVAKHSLTLEQQNEIEAIVYELNNTHKGKVVDIVGYADTTAGDKYNLELGLNRARSVLAKMMELGLDESIIIRKVSSYGYNNIVDSNKTNEGRQNNRRVEIFVR